MKRRKRTSDDGGLPIVSESAHIMWSEPAGDGLSRFFVDVDAPTTEFSIKECHGASHTIIDIDKSRNVRH